MICTKNLATNSINRYNKDNTYIVRLEGFGDSYMAVLLSDLYESVKNQDITLVAGEQGMGNVVRWLHMVESNESSSFLDGQEIAFTTGVGLNGNVTLLDLVKANNEHKASGMVVNIGPFVKEVPEDVIAYCNQEGFPLFIVPWQVHMAEIMRTICYMITESDKYNLELSSAVKNAIFFSNQEDLYVPQLERNNFLRNWSYCVTVIDIVDGEEKIADDKLQRYVKTMENYMIFSRKKTFVFELGGNIVLLFAGYSEPMVKKTVSDMLKRCNFQKEQCYVGIGRCTLNAQNIGKSYRQACQVLKLQRNMHNDKDVVAYQELGVYKLLMDIENQDVVNEYYAETIQRLVEYDKLNQTNYCDVLQCYLEHSGSVKETAEAMFVHRNTINYKINKIEEMLNCDLSELDTRLLYSIAFMLKKIM